MPEIKLLHGAGDIVSILEHALGEARAGRLEAVVIVGCAPEGSGWTGAYRDDMAYPWARIQAAVDTAQHELVAQGLLDWS